MKQLAFFVQTRIWVAMAAAVLTYKASILFCDKPDWFLLILVFFITQAAYLFLDAAEFKYRRIFIYFSTTGVVLGFFILPGLNWPVFLFCALLVLIYQTEWMSSFHINWKWELRKIPLIKNGAIAICWTSIVSLGIKSPLAEFDSARCFFLSSIFLFILAMSFAEDILDDSRDNFKTLGSVLGTRALRALGIAMIVLSFCLERKPDSNAGFPFTEILPFALAIAVTIFISPAGNRSIKSLVIDGTILLLGFC